MRGQTSQSQRTTSPAVINEYEVIEQLVWLHRDCIANYPGRTIEQHLDLLYPPTNLVVRERSSQLAADWPDRLPQLVGSSLFVGLESRRRTNQSKALWAEEVRAIWVGDSSSDGNGAAGKRESQADIDSADEAGAVALAEVTADATNTNAAAALVPIQPAQLVQPAASAGFKPTTMAQFGPGPLQPPTAQEQALRQMTGMSPNYHGDVHNVFNHSLNDLPDEENCSFWVSKLSREVEIEDITDQIRSCGRLAVVQITKAQANRWGAAAKVTFFEVEAAQEFYRRFAIFEEMEDPLYTGGLAGHFMVLGRRSSVVRNNVKVAASSAPNHHSRVVRVTGPRFYVQRKTILDVFEGKFVFQLERLIDHSSGDIGDLEFRFARYQEQAKFAILALFSELEENPQLHRSLRQLVKIRYWEDPCDRGV